MDDPSKIIQEMIKENALLKQRIQELEISETELKRMDEALRNSKLRYQTIFETTGTGMVILDEDMTISFANDGFENLTGYTREELEGKRKWTEFVEKDDLEKMITNNKLRRTDPGLAAKSYEFRLIHKDGYLKNILLTADLLPGTKSSVASLMDITDRKHTEEAFLESETKFKSFAEQALVGTYILQDGVFKYVNPKFAQMFGYTVEECLNDMPFENLVFTEDVTKVKEQIRRRILGEIGFVHYTFRGMKKNGQIFHVEIYGSQSVHKGRPAAAGTLLEITDRKKTEEALRISEEKYRQLAETAHDIIVSVDLNFRIIYANKATLSYFGEVDPVGRNLLDFTPPILHPFQKEIMQKRREGFSDMLAFEWDIIHPIGNIATFDIRASLLSDNGKPSGVMFVARDITENKQAQKALRESEARYRLLAENASDIIFTMDTNLKFTYISPSVERVRGYTAEEAMSQSPEEALTPASLEVAMKAFAEEIEIETKETKRRWSTRTEELEETCKDGSTIWTESSFSPIRDEKNKFAGFLGITRDITERKRTEDAIRKSEERYRTIFESTATANIIIAEDTTILMANNDFARLSGYAKQEMEGKISWTVFIHKDDVERMKSYHRMRRLHTGSALSSYEFSFINRNGEVRNLFISVALIPESKESIASMIDITEWKRSEQARSESEDRFKELSELLPETVYEADKYGIFTFVNKTGFEKFGYVQEDLSSKMSVFDMIIPQEHTRMIATYERLIKGERVGLGEYTARKKDGSTFPALVYATAIYHDGKPIGHRGFIIDISEKKNLENQLTRAQKMEAIGTLAGGIAHDFNNLLMGILGNISLILLKFDQTHPIYDRLKSMEEYVQRGSDLTKQLLGFARGGKYEVKPTDLGEFTRESSELFGRTKKEILIHHKAQEGLWTVEVDRGQMEQVLLNLYVNAWHAMPSGGDLYLSAENVELDDVDVSPYEINPGKFVKVTVTDTGKGMDEVTKTKIFEPFFTTKERGRGTGLGLASAYGIIKNHGGFIHVESEIDIGTSFIIYLPASGKDVYYDKKPEDQLLKGRETILLIDDEEMILDVSAKMLEELGYKVITASGGKNGILTYEQNKDRVDLVILDMIMPEFGGRESFDTMIRVNPSVRVLLSSGYSLDSQAKEIILRGCKGFIQKPFTMTDLSRKIREILDK